MTRKEFIKTILMGTLGGGTALLGVKCSSPTSPEEPNANEQTFSSSTAQGHVHSVTIQRSTIENPPSGGISMSTSTSSGHTHTFSMTQQQLQNVKDGQTVTVTDSEVQNHTHDYDISKWY